MKNLRITKIITALAITIWMPSSFASSPSVETPTFPLNVKITNGTSQVNLIYPTGIELCQDAHNCKLFSSHSIEKTLWPYYTEDSKQLDNELFKKLSEDWEKKQSLNIANLQSVLTFNLIGVMIRNPSSPQEDILSLINVATLSLESDYLIRKYNLSTRIDFFDYLSKPEVVKIIGKITRHSNGNAITFYIEIEVEDKVIKDLIKALEETFNRSARPFLSTY